VTARSARQRKGLDEAAGSSERAVGSRNTKSGGAASVTKLRVKQSAFFLKENKAGGAEQSTSAVSLRAAFFGARGSPALRDGNIVLESINTIGDGGCWPRGLAPRVKEKAPVRVLYSDGCP